MSKGRTTQALHVIRKVAEVNQVLFQPDLEQEPREEESEKEVAPKAKQSPLQMLRYPNLVVRSLIIFFNW